MHGLPLIGALPSKLPPLHAPQHNGQKVPEATSLDSKCSFRSFHRQKVCSHTFFIIKWKLGKTHRSWAIHCHCYLNALSKQGDMCTFWEGPTQLFLLATNTTVAGGFLLCFCHSPNPLRHTSSELGSRCVFSELTTLIVRGGKSKDPSQHQKSILKIPTVLGHGGTG